MAASESADTRLAIGRHSRPDRLKWPADPDELRAAVVLRDVADLDYAEIAEVLDVPVGTVKSRISRGRSALAERLRLHLDEPLSPDDGNRNHPDERPNDPT